MHRDILTTNQVRLLPLVKEFSRDYYLVGGTAIALYLLSRELGAGLVIIDELTARKVAIMMGLPIIGAIGLLIQAKRTGLIKEVKPLLDQMIRQGIRYKENFYREVLKNVNEL